LRIAGKISPTSMPAMKAQAASPEINFRAESSSSLKAAIIAA
jgi:hypothetical protein